MATFLYDDECMGLVVLRNQNEIDKNSCQWFIKDSDVPFFFTTVKVKWLGRRNSN